MSEFVEFEAIEDDCEREMMGECERVEERVSDREFIDDSEYDESVTDYYGFINVTKSYEEAMREDLEDDEIDENAKAENYCEDDEQTNVSVDEFKTSKERVEKFKSSLLNPQGLDNPDSFFYAILYALRYNQNDKTDPCADDSELRSDATLEIFDEISSLKDKLKLDLDILNFENQCFQINRILMKKPPLFESVQNKR